MTRHDTAAIRRLAARLESAAQDLSQKERSASVKIEGMADDMIGDTPKAIAEANNKLKNELKSIQKGLSHSADVLYSYARELDAADAKAQNEISSK